MNKSSTIGIFLIPTFIWLSLSFVYAFFCGDRDVDTYFFNSWDFAAWIIFASYTIIFSVVSIFFRLIMKKYYIVTMIIIIFIFSITVTDFDYIYSSFFFIIMLSIPLFGSLTLRYLRNKRAHHQRTGNQENEN
ncbi:hypothetical protein [Pectobacterium versatile]|uniref:hypothetical protein n=1 Tax=Pectobacterium versatile TaxID=2488639 RepID=UPI000F64AF75|nr:hypothetical protein [Pectobacterium versatile]AZK64535.1 hypothetical protein EIP93_20720 [Pectobacterium versatile]TAJ03285.1 hypothetical protein EG334_15230 [Pectobacterium versatile]